MIGPLVEWLSRCAVTVLAAVLVASGVAVLAGPGWALCAGGVGLLLADYDQQKKKVDVRR